MKGEMGTISFMFHRLTCMNVSFALILYFLFQAFCTLNFFQIKYTCNIECSLLSHCIYYLISI